jgi:uncharacterized protein DUF6919
MPEARDDAHLWAEARTLEDLGELTAQWLEGTIRYQPAWQGPRPHPETEPLVGRLAALNRSGFVTHFSQPGLSVPQQRGGQRATVSGFGTEETVLRLGSASLDTDLVALVYPPEGRLDALQIPISVLDGLVGIWAGAEMRPEAIDEFYGSDCHVDAVAALREAWQATVIDPHWGRDDLLWDRLDAALGGQTWHPPARP